MNLTSDFRRVKAVYNPILVDLIEKYVCQKELNFNERSQLIDLVKNSKTGARRLFRIDRNHHRKGEIVKFDLGSFSRVDLRKKSAGQISYKSGAYGGDGDIFVIDNPIRGLDIPYKYVKCSFYPGAEQETLVTGRYYIRSIRKIPMPGTSEHYGYTVPLAVLEEA